MIKSESGILQVVGNQNDKMRNMLLECLSTEELKELLPPPWGTKGAEDIWCPDIPAPKSLPKLALDPKGTNSLSPHCFARCPTGYFLCPYWWY